jgi:hypothetical protein
MSTTTTTTPAPLYRFVGRCKRCKTARQLVAYVVSDPKVGYVTIDTTGIYRACADLGTNPYKVVAECGDHRVALHRVEDTAKQGKARHECNAKCLASTGPACECKCKGANHGAGASHV